MKKLTVLVLMALLFLAVGGALAGGGPNGTYVHFEQGGTYDCHTYWRMTGSGLVHEWRSNPECAAYGGTTALHLVFKPLSRFTAPDCDDEGLLGVSLWTANLGYYIDYTDDEANLDDFITDGNEYWVCFYDWDWPDS